ncbi:MAG: amidohydrolase family protein [Verrucomicrobiales bacterium]
MQPKKITIQLAVSIALCCLALSAKAETLLLKNATIHSISSATLVKGDVLIEGGKIKVVKAGITEKADEEIDLQGHHLYPGLLGTVTSLGLVEINAVRATRDDAEVGEFTPEIEAWTAINPDSELIPVARANGITHVLSVPQGGIVSGYSSLVALHGWTIEDLAVKKQVGLHLFWPSMDLNTTPADQFKNKENFRSLEDQAKARSLKIKDIDDFFAEATSYAALIQRSGPAKSIPAWDAMLPWVRKETPIVIHADEYRQIKAALQWAKTNDYKIAIAGGRDAWRLASQLSAGNVPVIYDGVFEGRTMGSSLRDTEPHDINFRSPSVLATNGVKVIFSFGLAGFSAAHLRNLPYAAAQAVAFGLPEEEAIKGLTLYPAQWMGVDKQLGSIEPGKDATLIAVSGNILDVRSNVQQMWIQGRKINLESRHTRLYQKYQARPRQP